MIDLTPTIIAIIGLLAGISTLILWPWIKARLPAQKLEFLFLTPKMLVFAAEQLKLRGIIKDKLTYVQEQLLEKGFKIDINAIEAMVCELNISQGKETVKIE